MKRCQRLINAAAAGFLFLVVSAVMPASAFAVISVTLDVQSTPSTVRVTGTSAVYVTMTHVITVASGQSVAQFIEADPGARFWSADWVYGTVSSMPVRTGLTATTATFRETVLLDTTTIQNAIANGDNEFEYERRFFADPDSTGVAGSTLTDVVLTLTPASQTIGSLGIRRMDLYFKEDAGRVSETTVTKGTKGLMAWADVEVDGSGYLQGRWLVDGQIVEQVKKYASFGQKVTLSTSEIPGLTTFIPGLHTVQLEITDPVPPFDPPSLVYLVTEKAEGAAVPIAVESPAEGASVTRETSFAWTPTPRAAVYIATWHRAFDGREVLSAMVREGTYRAPEKLFADKFVAGVKYTWQVKGYDAEGRMVSEGPVNSFIAR